MIDILAGFGAGVIVAAVIRGLAALWDWAAYGRFENQMERIAARHAALAAREAIAANDQTTPTLRFVAPGWHPSCGHILQVWSEPHPAAVAEQILREAIA